MLITFYVFCISSIDLHGFVIDLWMDLGIIVDACLIPFSVRARNLLNPSKPYVFTMNLNDFTIQKNMICDDFHNLFHYKFWH